MSVTLTVPRSVFKTPQLKAAITINDAGVQSIDIDVEAAQEALKQALGCDVVMTVSEP